MRTDDLRETLARHGESFEDGAATVRLHSVRRRIVAARRRRRAAAGAGVAAVVLAVGGAISLPTLLADPEIRPADTPAPGELVGRDVPETLTSLGYTYEYAAGYATSDGVLRVNLPASDSPRLVSWAGEDDGARLELRNRWSGERLARSDEHFADFAVLYPGSRAELALRADQPGDLGLAVYELTDARPPGVTSEEVTFRQQVGDRELLGATIGEPGQAEVSVEFTVPEAGELAFTSLCRTSGQRVEWEIRVDGDGPVSSQCGDEDPHDPGASSDTGFTVGTRPMEPGRQLTATMRVLPRGGQALTDDLVVGLGVYEVGSTTRLAGWDLEDVVEHDGHVWSLAGTEEWRSDGTERIDAAREDLGEPQLVATTVRSPGGAGSWTTLIDGEQDGATFGGGGMTLGPVFWPGDTDYTIRTRGMSSPTVGVATYLRVD